MTDYFLFSRYQRDSTIHPQEIASSALLRNSQHHMDFMIDNKLVEVRDYGYTITTNGQEFLRQNQTIYRKLWAPHVIGQHFRGLFNDGANYITYIVKCVDSPERGYVFTGLKSTVDTTTGGMLITLVERSEMPFNWGFVKMTTDEFKRVYEGLVKGLSQS